MISIEYKSNPRFSGYYIFLEGLLTNFYSLSTLQRGLHYKAAIYLKIETITIAWSIWI